jgi:superfamily II DNA or RNA helicase
MEFSEDGRDATPLDTRLIDESYDVNAPIPGLTMSNGFRFRRGQHIFLSRLAEAFRQGETSHLGVFVPGYGKTITALTSFVVAFHAGVARKLVVFVPRGNLRDQYADPTELARVLENIGAPQFSYCVADSEKVFLKNLDTQIIITTYQYASGRGGHKALLRYCQSAPCLFVFDEVHHLSEDGLWASKIDEFPHVSSVALSGTPMRSDNKTLFGVPLEVREDGDQYYVALHEVTMRDAHEEGGILKRVEAHVVDYRIKMVRADTGEEVEMSLSIMADMVRTSKEVDIYLARRKLRFHDVYLESLLGPAFERFAEKRGRLRETLTRSGRAAQGPFRNHQMLIIAMSNRHAAAILDFVRARFPQFISARIGQDLPSRECAASLEAYREGRIDVMVQVDMIGEGTDIKPISVIVKADLVRAHSKTLQQVFRGMRYFDGFPADENVCDIFAANDSGIVHVLEWITSEQQIGIKLRTKRANGSGGAPPGEREQSAWELKDVHTHRMRSHSLDLFPGYGAEAGTLMLREVASPRSAQAQAIDVNEVEKQLRKDCAALASELYYVLQAEGQYVEIRDIHARAKKHLQKSQGDLSIIELEKKKKWLERAIRSRRLS